MRLFDMTGGIIILLLIFVIGGWSTPAESACSCERDKRGACERSWLQRQAFLRATGYPHGRPGWHVDHMRPLCCAGEDRPENMQWMRIEEKRIKDRWELDCSRYLPRERI